LYDYFSFCLVITSVHLNPRETINGLSAIPMSMPNIGNHLMSSLNPTHLTDGAGTYFVAGIKMIFDIDIYQ
jgi:hypothetical protein